MDFLFDKNWTRRIKYKVNVSVDNFSLPIIKKSQRE